MPLKTKKLNEGDYDVLLDDGTIVGRTTKMTTPEETHWEWHVTVPRPNADATSGIVPTRKDALKSIEKAVKTK